MPLSSSPALRTPNKSWLANNRTWCLISSLPSRQTLPPVLLLRRLAPLPTLKATLLLSSRPSSNSSILLSSSPKLDQDRQTPILSIRSTSKTPLLSISPPSRTPKLHPKAFRQATLPSSKALSRIYLFSSSHSCSDIMLWIPKATNLLPTWTKTLLATTLWTLLNKASVLPITRLTLVVTTTTTPTCKLMISNKRLPKDVRLIYLKSIVRNSIAEKYGPSGNMFGKEDEKSPWKSFVPKALWI